MSYTKKDDGYTYDDQGNIVFANKNDDKIIKDKSIVDMFLDGVLMLATMAGLYLALVLSLNIQLDSDTVVPGLVSMAMKTDPLLRLFSLRVMDPYLADLAYYVPLQLISGYNPLVLRLSAYLIFLGILASFAYIVYKAAGWWASVAFSALFVNMSAATLATLVLPDYHNSAILFAGVLIILYARYGSWKWFWAVLAAITLVSAYSDVLFLAIMAAPMFIFLSYKKEWRNATAVLGATFVVVALKFRWLIGSSTSNAGQGIDYLGLFKAAVLYVPSVLNGEANAFITGSSSQLGMIATLFIALFSAMTIGYAVRRTRTILPQNRYYMLVILPGAIFLMLAYITGAFTEPRYLTYLAITFCMLAASMSDQRLLKIIIVAVAVMGLIANAGFITNMSDNRPNNADTINMANYLVAHNYTYGYSDYWHSSINTYLTAQRVVVMPLCLDNNTTIQESNNIEYQWYKGNGFILDQNDTIQTPDWHTEVQGLIKEYPPEAVDVVNNNTTIYTFNQSTWNRMNVSTLIIRA